MTNYPLSKFTGQQVVQYYDPSGPRAGDMFWSMATSREGCYIANGADYAQADEPELFAEIGTAFNTQINPTTGSAWASPGAGRFRVPDMRGVVPRGAGTPFNGSALAVGAYEADQIQAHSHRTTGVSFPVGNGTTISGSGRIPLTTAGSETANLNNVATGTPTDAGATSTSTIRSGTETRVKARGGNWFIRRFNPTPQVVGAGIVTANTPGLTPPETPQTALTVTSGVAGYTNNSAVGIAYQDKNGAWRLKANIQGTFTALSPTANELLISITGVTFKAGLSQAGSGFLRVAGQKDPGIVFTVPNTGGITIEAATARAYTAVYAYVDVELAAKPSWA